MSKVRRRTACTHLVIGRRARAGAGRSSLPYLGGRRTRPLWRTPPTRSRRRTPARRRSCGPLGGSGGPRADGVSAGWRRAASRERRARGCAEPVGPAHAGSARQLQHRDDDAVGRARYAKGAPPGQVGQAAVDDGFGLEPHRRAAGREAVALVVAGLHRAGRDGDGPHTGACERRRDAVGEAQHPGLACAVRPARRWEIAREARHVDHGPAAAGDHPGQRGPRETQDRGDVDVELVLQRLHRRLVEQLLNDQGRVVDQDVHRRRRVGEPLLDHRALARHRQVRGQRLDTHAVRGPQLLGRLRQPLLVPGDEHEVVAVGREPPRERGPEAGVTARDQSRGHGRTVTDIPHPSASRLGRTATRPSTAVTSVSNVDDSGTASESSGTTCSRTSNGESARR